MGTPGVREPLRAEGIDISSILTMNSWSVPQHTGCGTPSELWV